MIHPVTYVGLKLPMQKRVMNDTYLYEIGRVKLTERVKDAIFNICVKFEISPMELKSKGRARRLVMARCILANYLKTHTVLTLKQIGRILGGRDHTTVLYNLSLYKDLLEFNKDFQDIVKKINL